MQSWHPFHLAVQGSLWLDWTNCALNACYFSITVLLVSGHVIGATGKRRIGIHLGIPIYSGRSRGRFSCHFSSRINQTADEAQDLPKFAVCSRTDSPRQSGQHQILLAWLRREKKTVLLFEWETNWSCKPGRLSCTVYYCGHLKHMPESGYVSDDLLRCSAIFPRAFDCRISRWC